MIDPYGYWNEIAAAELSRHDMETQDDWDDFIDFMASQKQVDVSNMNATDVENDAVMHVLNFLRH